ncbi:MAG: sigma-70 family RNA polymerase sigma factor [Actinobacteria bacterium]|nr:MAG: sigma-70 family RNA polymerase sigma factor [Actinomycetota bacterium]
MIIGTLHRLREDASFDAWMWAIGRNQLRGWLRKRTRGTLVEPIAPAMQSPEDAVLLSEEHAGIRSALSSLSQRDRNLLWLREVEGLSYAEIGGRMGAATGTVRVACHRARKRLEKAFRGDDEEGEGMA